MRAALGVVVALGVAGGLLQWAGPWRTAAHAAGAPPGAVYRVARQDFTVTLTELGRLVAQDSRKVVFEAEGQNKIVSLVEEGKQVAEGEVLLTCDTTNVEKRIEELGLALAQAESDLRTAQTELEIQEAENAAEVEKTAATLDRARKELQRYREADAPQERRGLEVKLKDTQTAFRRAKKRYEDSQNLLAKGYLKQAELETDQIAYEKALVEKEGAEQALSVFDRYTLPMTLDEKETKVRDAARDQETAAKRAGSRMLQRQVTLTSAQKRLEQNRTSLDEARQDLEHLVVRSPCPGIVIYGDPKGTSGTGPRSRSAARCGRASP